LRRDLVIILVLALTMLVACEKDPVMQTGFYECNLPFADSSAANPLASSYSALLSVITGDGVPGIMMSIVQPETGLWTGASGMADLSGNVALQPCNITRVGSTVKTFTAVTVMMLAEEGKLSLDDSASKYLSSSDIRDIENAGAATIRQLMQHSSGIYNYIENLQFQTASLNDLVRTWSADDLLEYARKKPACFKPGSDVRYSNTNYILLGMIISNVEGKPFYDVFKEKIFDPLGLAMTKFAATDPVPDGIIRGYVDFYSTLDVMDATWYSGWDYYTADGGLISNPNDMNIFLNALFDGQLISAASLKEMTSWMTPSEQDPEFFPVSYGLGIFRMETPWGEAWFHSGDAIGYYAAMTYFPDSRTFITWAVNGNYGNIDQYTQTKAAMERIFGTVFGSQVMSK
jgi:D-alanyl-D-alanine carboxypeptidase